MSAAELIRLIVRVGPDEADGAIATATELLGTGCRERREGGEAVLDFWVRPSGAPGPSDVEAALDRCGIRSRVEAVPEREDWQEAIRRFHTPFAVGPLWIRPPWTPAVPGRRDVVIDPGMAFGTGQHATTRGCLELLVGLAPCPAVDVGCGSGILAIAARRLGFDPVRAIDADPLAVEATLANAHANRVGLGVACRTIGRDRLPSAPLLLANLTAATLDLLAAHPPDPLPEQAILSGLRPDEVAAVVRRYASLDMHPRERAESDDWVALLLERA